MIRVAIINDTRPTNHYGCMLVMQNLTNLLTERNVEVLWTWPVGIDWRKHKNKIKKQPKVDAIIVNGEGTIHHSAERKHARALSEFAEFALNELDTPSYLINATLYKNDAALYGRLKAYKAIYVRDRESLVELESFGLQGQYVPDLTFAKAQSYQYKPLKKGCMIDTALKSEIPSLKKYCRTHGFDFRSMVVARPSNANFFKSPRPFVKNVFKWLTSDHKISSQPAEFINYLCNYELIITGRYHTVTMCLKNKIPFVAIESNTPKISFILQDALGNTSRVTSFGALDSIDLDQYKSFTKEEMQTLTGFIDRAEKDINAMLDSLINKILNRSELKKD